jgi:3-oxoacyl-[acyl-carrier protein] reductase
MSRVVLVTGGSRGIGLACARRFAALGDHVAVTYNSSPPPEGLFGIKCDVTSTEEVDAAFKAVEEKFGPVEILVSNAGITKDTLLLRMSEADFSAVVDANLTASFRVVKRATQGMLRARKGRIILMSSVVGLLGSAGQANYAASKAGLVGFARSLARELGSRSITVNVVAPGPEGTDGPGAPVPNGDRRRDRGCGGVPRRTGFRVHHRGRHPCGRRPGHGSLTPYPAGARALCETENRRQGEINEPGTV